MKRWSDTANFFRTPQDAILNDAAAGGSTNIGRRYWGLYAQSIVTTAWCTGKLRRLLERGPAADVLGGALLLASPLSLRFLFCFILMLPSASHLPPHNLAVSLNGRAAATSRCALQRQNRCSTACADGCEHVQNEHVACSQAESLDPEADLAAVVQRIDALAAELRSRMAAAGCQNDLQVLI